MFRTLFARLCYGLFAGVFISLGIGATIVANGLYDTESRARELSRFSSIRPKEWDLPHMRPEPGQKSIEAAMSVFEIKIPRNIKGPFYDPKLQDRGLTIRHGIGSDPIVYIGKEAFESWSLLGSTLAHEIEIHCRQNFMAIHLENLAGFDGTGAAEREAYMYELANSLRFGLSQYDQEMIKSAMVFFYPERASLSSLRVPKISRWVDRLSGEPRLNPALN